MTIFSFEFGSAGFALSSPTVMPGMEHETQAHKDTTSNLVSAWGLSQDFLDPSSLPATAHLLRWTLSISHKGNLLASSSAWFLLAAELDVVDRLCLRRAPVIARSVRWLCWWQMVTLHVENVRDLWMLPKLMNTKLCQRFCCLLAEEFKIFPWITIFSLCILGMFCWVCTSPKHSPFHFFSFLLKKVSRC